MEDVKAILTPAIQANAVAPNDLRDILSKALNKPLEAFDGDEYNYPVKNQTASSALNLGELDVSKAYGEGEVSEVAASIRRMIRSVKADE